MGTARLKHPWMSRGLACSSSSMSRSRPASVTLGSQFDCNSCRHSRDSMCELLGLIAWSADDPCTPNQVCLLRQKTFRKVKGKRAREVGHRHYRASRLRRPLALRGKPLARWDGDGGWGAQLPDRL